MTNSMEHQVVMKRVRRIHRLRTIFAPAYCRLYALIALTLALSSVVSVRNVLENLMAVGEPLSMMRYILSALLETEVLVQVLFLGISLVLLWSVVALIRRLPHGTLTRSV